MPIKWRGIGKYPIPETWQHIGQGTSIFHLAGNRNASHPVNAILNYAYTVLQSEIQINAISEGLNYARKACRITGIHIRYDGARAAYDRPVSS